MLPSAAQPCTSLSVKPAVNEGAFAWYVVALLPVALVSVTAMPDMQRDGHLKS